jgi:Domain of unknown function (DUF1707)/Inner membrane component of T3SS, cytoplasmic domain
MAGSAAEAPTTPDAESVGRVRASDAERDEALARLREEFAAGRLSHDTFLLRLDAVLKARHQADLPPLLADLPAGQPSLAGRLRAALDRRLRPRAARAGDPVPGRASAGSAPARRLTLGMTRAAGLRPLFRGGRGVVPPKPAGPPADPLALRFPRGSGAFFSIGRDVGCDLAIADMTVSRVHARLERTADGWLLTDLASTNGTRVNGWRVRGQVPVTAGDRVSFGNAEYRLSAAEPI